jgi:hypothetical protein
MWLFIREFVARDPVERVRNCIRVEKSVQESVISLVISQLLASTTPQPGTWRHGGWLAMSSLSHHCRFHSTRGSLEACAQGAFDEDEIRMWRTADIAQEPVASLRQLVAVSLPLSHSQLLEVL